MQNPVNEWINAAIQDWLSAHPYTTWLVTHPLLTGFLILSLVILLWGFLGSIARLVQDMWISVLQLPIKIISSLLIGLFNLIRGLLGKPALPLPLDGTGSNQQAQVQTILQEIEALRQQEAALLQKLKTLTQK